MSDQNIKKNSDQKSKSDLTGDVKVPLRHKLQIKDLIHPITITRMRILQFAFVGLAVLLAGAYYFGFLAPKPNGTALVNEWVEASGGMEAWNKIDNGSFERVHTLYAENGNVLKEKTEKFFFEKINGEFKLLTNYTTPEGTNLWMGNDKEGYWAMLNDLPADPKKSANDLGFMCDSKWCKPDCSMKMTLYRFGMPFNLVGNGILPNLAGSAEVNGMNMNILNVSYNPSVGKDRWVFYADEKSNLIKKIEYHHKNDHGHSFPEEMYWDDYKKVAGLQIPHSWKRYWTNGQVLEDYQFSKFEFNKALPDMFASRPN